MDIGSLVSIFESTKVQFFLELQAALGVFYILAIFVIYLLIIGDLVVNKRINFIFVICKRSALIEEMNSFLRESNPFPAKKSRKKPWYNPRKIERLNK